MAVYLDYAAATPVDKTVLAAMMPYYSEKFYNPSAIYMAARECRIKLDDFRARTAKVIGASRNEIVFCAGASEANNLALNGVVGAYGGNVISSAIEHDSVIKNHNLLPRQQLTVDKKGRLNITSLKSRIDDQVSLISVAHISNELGVVQPLNAVSELVAEVRKDRQKRGVKLPLLLHTDASQSLYLDVHVSRLGVDLMTISGGKMYGPKQSAALYVRAGIVLTPQIVGGGQEFGLRAGTESLAQICGFTTALELANKRAQLENRRLSDLRAIFVNNLENLGGQVLGHEKYHTPHIVSVRFSGFDNERLVMELDEAGVQVASGSACKASSGESSTVLKAIGLSEKEAGEVLRFSFGLMTTEEHISQAILALTKILRD